MKTMQKQSYNFYRITQLLQRFFIREEAGYLASKSKGNPRSSPSYKLYGLLHLQHVLVGWKALLRIQSHRRMQIFQKKYACLAGCEGGYEGSGAEVHMKGSLFTLERRH